MNTYQLKIIEFMRHAASASLDTSKMALKPVQSDVEYYLKKMYENDPNRPFSIRMSTIGKPLCQLQMEQAKAKGDKIYAVDDDWFLPLRFMYGAVIEGLAVSTIRHSGIKIDAEQLAVELNVGDIVVPGTLDLVIDGKVWDIKSASPYSFENKFASYDTLKEQDIFGYLCQLYGYSKAANLKPGGFIVIDKSSGEIKWLEVPENYEEEQARCLKTISDNVIVLTTDSTFKRQFQDKDETYRKKLTGNRVLNYPCTYCKFRYACWPGLQNLPVKDSTAYNKPMRYYTKITNDTTIS